MRHKMRKSIEDISAERNVQHARWGNFNDDRWSSGEWGALISHYATRQMVGDLHAIDRVKLREDLVKAGAVCAAAIDALDRADGASE